MTSSRSLRPAALAVAVAACLGALVYASAHPSPWHFSLPDWRLSISVPPPLPDTSMGQLPGEIAPISQPSPVWVYILTGLAIAAAGFVIFLIARAIYRTVKAITATRLETVPPVTLLPVGASVAGTPLTPQQVMDAVGVALTRLDSAASSSDAIIAAWLAFEDAALRHGMARDPASTPTEFTAALLNRSLVPEQDTVALRTVYLRTRFSDIPATSADVRAARGWLQHIARTLEGAPV